MPLPDWLFRNPSDAHFGRRIPGLDFVLAMRPDASLVIRFDNGVERPAELTEMAMWHMLCRLTEDGDGRSRRQP